MRVVPLKISEKLTIEKSSLFVGLVVLLDMPLCSQVSLGHCILCIFLWLVQRDRKFAWVKKGPQRLTRHILSPKHPGSKEKKIFVLFSYVLLE